MVDLTVTVWIMQLFVLLLFGGRAPAGHTARQTLCSRSLANFELRIKLLPVLDLEDYKGNEFVSIMLHVN